MAKTKETNYSASWELAAAAMEKELGNSFFTLASRKVIKTEVIPSGSISLDTALGTFGWPQGRIVELWGEEASGKAQPLSSKILTPSGWKLMGEISTGDVVCTPDGRESTVIGVFPQGRMKTFSVRLDDKTEVLCTEDHLWLTYTRGTRLGEVLTTKELMEKGTIDSYGKRKFKIPVVKPLELEGKKELEIDPYLLGLILGDGELTDNSVKISTMDDEILDYIRDIIKTKYDNLCLSGPHGPCTYNFKKIVNGKQKTLLYHQLDRLGLIGKFSYEKHIPSQYLTSSIGQRTRLLRGLMDSDGTISEGGTISFTTTSPVMNEGFRFLVKSLGMRCVTSSRHTKYTSPTGEKLDGRKSFRSSIILREGCPNPFRLSRKRDMVRDHISTHQFCFIELIEEVGSDECQCIAIGHPDQLYITDGFAVTHNTTIMLNALGQAQKKFPDKQALLVDMEHAFDPAWARKNGVQDNLGIIQPDFAEQALNSIERVVSTGMASMIALDSISGLVPRAEREGLAGDQHVGLQARLISQFCRKIVPLLSHTGTLLMCANQIRYKIIPYGNPETTSGGNSLKFYASMRVRTKRATQSDQIKEGSEIIGENITAEVKKNKLAPPFRSAVIPIVYNRGLSPEFDLLDAATEDKIIDKGGAWYTIPVVDSETGEVKEERVQGRTNAVQFMHGETYRTIYEQVKAKRTTDTEVLDTEEQ